MQHRIPHGLAHDLARRATRAALESYRQRFAAYEPGGEWRTEDLAIVWFKVAGTRLEGTIEVADQAILLELEVPLVFRPIRKLALEVIEREVRAWIERARVGELS